MKYVIQMMINVQNVKVIIILMAKDVHYVQVKIVQHVIQQMENVVLVQMDIIWMEQHVKNVHQQINQIVTHVQQH